MSTKSRAASAATALFASILIASAANPSYSAELTNGKNGGQPNSLDSESSGGTAGVAPSKDVSKQGSNLKPDSAQSREQAPAPAQPRQ